jgi:hypothetical protein
MNYQALSIEKWLSSEKNTTTEGGGYDNTEYDIGDIRYDADAMDEMDAVDDYANQRVRGGDYSETIKELERYNLNKLPTDFLVIPLEPKVSHVVEPDDSGDDIWEYLPESDQVDENVQGDIFIILRNMINTIIV